MIAVTVMGLEPRANADEARGSRGEASPDVPDTNPPSGQQLTLAPWEIVAEFLKHSRPIEDAERDLLAHQGIEGETLQVDRFLPGASPVRVARVTTSAEWFDFGAGHDDTGARWALVLPARDEDGSVRDLVGFDLAGWQARWLGAMPILGAHNLERPRLTERVPCFETVADWLKAGRDGLVILDPRRARWRLADMALSTPSADSARRLRRALAVPLPNIKIERAQ